MKKIISGLKLLLVWSILILVLGEVSVRLFVDLPESYADEKTACYRFDEALGWFPKEEATCVHEAMYKTHITNNREGFRDKNHNNADRRKKMAVLGDSFVWGYDVNDQDRFTTDLQTYLPQWDIYNLGVSGYGTDQEFILLQKWFPQHQPDVVCLMVHSNDSTDNSTNYQDNYYKPYFTLEGGKLTQQGVPVPKCFRYQQQQFPTLFKSHFIQGVVLLYNKLTNPAPIKVPNLQLELIAAMHEYVLAQGAEFRVYFTYAENQPQTDRFLAAQEIPHLALPTPPEYRFSKYGKHWTPDGHEYIAEKILEDLYHAKILVDADFDRKAKVQ